MKKASILKLFKKSKEEVRFVGEYLEVRLPRDFFTSYGYSEEISDYVSTLLMFDDVRYYPNPKGEGKYEKIQFTPSPSTIITHPSEKKIEGDEYVMIYHKNDIFIESTVVAADWRNASNVNDALLTGKLSNVKYGELATLIIDAFDENYVGTGMTPHMTMIYVGEVCTVKGKRNKKLRQTKDVNANTTEYEIIPIKQLPQQTGTASTLLFEQVHIGAAARVGTKNIDHKASPIEQSVLYNTPEENK